MGVKDKVVWLVLATPLYQGDSLGIPCVLMFTVLILPKAFMEIWIYINNEDYYKILKNILKNHKTRIKIHI